MTVVVDVDVDVEVEVEVTVVVLTDVVVTVTVACWILMDVSDHVWLRVQALTYAVAGIVTVSVEVTLWTCTHSPSPSSACPSASCV